MKKTKAKKCQRHNWRWHYDCFEDAVSLEFDKLGIPVKCSICKQEGTEWWGYSYVKDKEGVINQD